MSTHVFLDAFTHVPRSEAIERLKSAVSEAEGAILDFAFFSNKAIRLNIELEDDGLARLARALESAEVHLFEKSKREVESTPRPKKPMLAFLNVTFVDDAPDLAIEVPHVPG